MFDRCNQEWHKRADIDKSRREFNWKVVEPYDGQFRSQLSKLKEGLGFSWEKIRFYYSKVYPTVE